MNNELENSGKIPWYRGRLFWGGATILVAIGIPIFWALLIGLDLILVWFINAGPTMLLLQLAVGMSDFTRLLGQILYLLIAIMLLYLSFKNKRVRILCVTTLIINTLIGILIIGTFLSGL